jgi:hypothetical protein
VVATIGGPWFGSPVEDPDRDLVSLDVDDDLDRLLFRRVADGGVEQVTDDMSEEPSSASSAAASLAPR